MLEELGDQWIIMNEDLRSDAWVRDLKENGNATSGKKDSLLDNLLHVFWLPIRVKELVERDTGHELWRLMSIDGGVAGGGVVKGRLLIVERSWGWATLIVVLLVLVILRHLGLVVWVCWVIERCALSGVLPLLIALVGTEVASNWASHDQEFVKSVVNTDKVKVREV
jgi:hypothetical protein